MDRPPAAPFGRMLTGGPSAARSVQVLEHNYRTGLVLREPITLSDGTHIRDINAKGLGGWRTIPPDTSESVVRDAGHEPVTPTRGAHDEPFGLCEKAYALWDRDQSEYLRAQGLRTHIVLAILDLEELIVDGKTIKVLGSGFGTRHIAGRPHYDEKTRPVIALRGFRTTARVEHALDRVLLDDAIQLVEDETHGTGQLSADKRLTIAGYAQWFAATLGDQIGHLHALGRTHRYVTPNNVTLACEITDLDSVDDASIKSGDQAGGYILDIASAINVANRLASALTTRDPNIASYRPTMGELCLAAYTKASKRYAAPLPG